MGTRPQTLLIFTQDPGAANCVADLPCALGALGWKVHLLTRGVAGSYLARRGISSCEVPSACSADALLAELEPTLCLVGTAGDPDTFGLALIDAARRVGIPSVGVMDACMNAASRFCGRSKAPLTHAPDWLLVPDEATKDAMAMIGYPTERMVLCGHPHYDYVLAERRRLSALDRNGFRKRLGVHPESHQPVVLYAAERLLGPTPGTLQYSEQYTLSGYSGSIGREEIVLEEFLGAVDCLAVRPYLILRLHPTALPGEYDAYAHKFDQVSQGELALEMIHVSDLVVGMSSMFLLEAVIMGIRTLSILPLVEEQDWLPSIRMGYTPCVNTRETLQSTLASLVRASDPVAARPMPAGFVGDALGRLVDSILRIASVRLRHG